MSSAAREISKSITNLKSVSGFGFATSSAPEQARVLRELADQIEKKDALVQSVTFSEETTINDFVMFRYSIKFAERQPKDEPSDNEAVELHGGESPLPVAIAKKE